MTKTQITERADKHPNAGITIDTVREMSTAALLARASDSADANAADRRASGMFRYELRRRGVQTTTRR
jgi:hypothetical protein